MFVRNAIRHRITSRKITNSDEYNTQSGCVQVASAYGMNAANPLVASIKEGNGTNAFNLAYTYDGRQLLLVKRIMRINHRLLSHFEYCLCKTRQQCHME